MRKNRLFRLAFAVAVLILGFTSIGLATPRNCTIVNNFCSGCAGGKVRSCDRYRCVDDLTGQVVFFNSCTACGNAC